MLRTRFIRLFPLLIAAFASTASGTITLEMTTLFGGNIASNFGNAAVVATDGMKWGIVVDTGATAGVFSTNFYTPFNVATGGFLSTAGGLTDDYYFPASALTFDTSLNAEGGGALGDNGTIGTITGVPFGGGTNIAQNQRFGLIWFSSNSAATVGDNYGFFTDPALTTPADGQSVVRSTPFAGVDQVRGANSMIVAVPEPGSLGFICVGILGLGSRRLRFREFAT